MDWIDQISRFWPHLAAGCDFLAALLASVFTFVWVARRFGAAEADQ